ncbi:MAG: signal peptidase I [Clostridiales bacterium]|nr:signal peptidase I [Clostridiales bacterium]
MGKKKESTPLTPEQVIRKSLHRLADAEDIRSFFVRLVWMALLLGILFGKVFGLTSVKNNEMSPRLSSGDLLLYYRLDEEYRSQDIIIYERNNREYIGRVIAKGGESAEVTEEERVKVNGSVLIESDIYYSTPRFEDGIEFPVTLAEDEYFILCDYRANAIDSRVLGPIKKSEIKGKVISAIRRSSL